MNGDRLRRGCGTELLPQEPPEPLEDPHPLGDVALRGERLHEQHVARLAVGLEVQERAPGTLDGAELAAAEDEPGTADELQRAEPHLGQIPPARFDPPVVGAGQQPAGGDVERHLRQGPGAAGVAPAERLLGAGELGAGGLEVDPHRLGQLQDDLVAADDRSGTER